MGATIKIHQPPEFTSKARIRHAHGEAKLSSSSLRMDLKLISDNADMALKDYRFATSLDVGVKASGGATDTADLDISGTYVKLIDAALATGEEATSAEKWDASLTLSDGRLAIPVTADKVAGTGFPNAMQTFRDKQLREVLASVDADLAAQLIVSDLGWINLLFRNDFDLAVSGGGEAAVDVAVRSGWLAEGTSLHVQPTVLTIRVLDYIAQGDGRLEIAVQGGGETPDMLLDATLDGGNLRRQGEKSSVVDSVNLALAAKAQGVRVGGEPTVTALDLKIPSARVSDMSVYNQYFPKKLPLRLISGEAELTADIHLERESAGGYVRLLTDGLQSQLNDQQLAAKLAVDVNLKDGVPANMEFDISDSKLRLDQVRVVGAEATFNQPGWAAQFDLQKGRVVWKKPVQLDVEAAVTMQDSQPIVALLANQRGKHGWIEKMLTVEHIKGTAKLQAASGEIVIPYAMVGSDKIDVGAKGLANDSALEGIFFARFRKLKGILKVKDGKRNFDIIGARKRFDAYSPGLTDFPLGVNASLNSNASDAAADANTAPVTEKKSAADWNGEVPTETPLNALGNH